MIPLYTRYLMPEDYGVLELFDVTLNVMSMIVGLRLGSAFIRYYHYYDTQDDKHEVLSTAFIFTLFFSISILVVVELLSTPISVAITGTDTYKSAFQIVFVCFALQNVYTVNETYLLAEKKSSLYSMLSIITLTLNLSFNILFLVVFELGIYSILFSMLITKTINAAVIIPITMRHVRFSFSKKKLFQMIKFGAPLVPAGIALFTIHFSDRLFIQKYCSLSELGVYSLGYKFGMIVSVLISQPIFKVWNTQRFEIAKQIDAKKIYSLYFTYYTSIVAFFGLAISVFIKEIIWLLATESYQGASLVVPLIVLGYVFFGMSGFLTLAFVIKNRTGKIAYIQGAVAILNLIFNYVLIKNYGVLGAAVSTVLTYGTLMICTLTFSQKIYFVPFEYARLLKFFCTALVVYFFSTFEIGGVVTRFAYKILLMGIFPLLLLLFGFFQKDEIAFIKNNLFLKPSKLKIK